jgi:hypothetical protein
MPPPQIFMTRFTIGSNYLARETDLQRLKHRCPKPRKLPIFKRREGKS